MINEKNSIISQYETYYNIFKTNILKQVYIVFNLSQKTVVECYEEYHDYSDTSKDENYIDNEVIDKNKEDIDNKEFIDPDIDKVGGWVYMVKKALFLTQRQYTVIGRNQKRTGF